jgi:hypothetical protein
VYGWPGQSIVGHDNSLINLFSSNNAAEGLDIFWSNSNRYYGVVSAHNEGHAVSLGLMTEAQAFHGLLRTQASGAFRECAVTGGNAAPGLIDTTCTDSGAAGSSAYTGQLSTAVFTPDVSLASTLVGGGRCLRHARRLVHVRTSRAHVGQRCARRLS